MDWYRLFRQHILDRGIEYYEGGYVTEFAYTDNNIKASVDGSDIYDVEISLDGEDVLDMYCSCPYAADGHNCKHMAAVLFKFEALLSERDATMEYGEVEDIEADIEPTNDFLNKVNKRRAEVVELISQIPEDKVRELLVGFVIADEGLKNKLTIQYAFKMNNKLMLELRTELEQIEKNYCRSGYVDWYHASDFTSELSAFLDSKVQLLIEKDCLRQAFDLTNRVFFCIGNVDMDDSDGSSSVVLNSCYECWKEIIEKSDDDFKEEIKGWFENHRTGYVIDFMDEYIEEILFDAFATKEVIMEEIHKLDTVINNCKGTDCGRCYSIHYGYENPILKRIELMKKMGCTENEIHVYKKRKRRFFVIRELEIADAIEARDFETAISVLQESKKLDSNNKGQIKKYSEKLIDIYKITGAAEDFCRETIYFLETFWQYDLKYVNELKKCIREKEKWNSIVDGIVTKNSDESFVCKLLSEEKRYNQLMDKIENSTERIRLLDTHEKVLRKRMPDRVIRIYSAYLEQAVDMANDRNKYKGLVVYLKKISSCAGGKEVAKKIADSWRQVYKRRSAMMDEMRKMGF